tara:strand:- start:3681 stop:4658 length:978 start_codon:yes stop_codon:yes gene_type:complete
MKSFKRFLKEEYQGPGDLDLLQALMGYEQESADSATWYYYAWGGFGFATLTADNQSVDTSSNGLLGGEFPLVNAPQVMIDAMDFNGDGIIGANDVTLAHIVGRTIFDYMIENDSFEGFPPIMTPAIYREMWQDLNEQYGLDLPDPNGFNLVLFNGEYVEIPDSDFAYPYGANPVDYEQEISSSGSWINYLLNSLFIWFGDLDGVRGLAALFGAEFALEMLRRYDYNGDGDLEAGFGGPNGDFGVASIYRSLYNSTGYEWTAPEGYEGMLQGLRRIYVLGDDVPDGIPPNILKFFGKQILQPPENPPPPQRPEEPPVGGEAPPPRG